MSAAPRTRRREVVARDQHESAFASILAELVDRVPGARAAVLVDRQGESVDYAGRLDPFGVRLAAAHWRIVMDEVNTQPAFNPFRWLALRAGRASYVVYELPEEYALIVILARAAGFSGWRRAVSACAHALGDEAGWSLGGAPWVPLQVTTDERRRPRALRQADPDAPPRPIVILGTVAGGLGRHEHGWRVRFDTGVEATLVREPGGVWYSDEPLDSGGEGRRDAREKSR